MLDSHDWKIVLKVYAGNRGLALILAQHLDHLKRTLEQGPKGAPEVITGLTLGIENLYPHTMFYAAGQKLYELAVAGDLPPEYEDLIRELGL